MIGFRGILGIMCVAPATLAAQICEGPQFHQQVYLQFGPARTTELADLDGDGDLDLVVGHTGPPSVTVRLNRGDGVFDLAGQYNDIGNTIDLALGDVDRDGDIDIVAVTQYDRRVSVFLNRGNAEFDLFDRFAIAGSVDTVIGLGEVDGDGLPDLVLYDLTGLHLLSNLGGGTFERPGDGESVGLFQTIDVNADGLVDLFVQQSGAVKFRINDGSGGFEEIELFEATGAPETEYAIFDANADGLLDVVRVIRSIGIPPGAYTRLQRPDGSFSTPVYSDLGLRTLGTAKTFLDVDGDGFDDIVDSLGTSPAYGVIRSLGDGRLETFDVIESWIGSFSSVASGDLNSNGWADLVLGGSDTGIHLRDGIGGFPTSTVGSIAGRGGLATGDFNGDGLTDIAGVDYLDDTLQIAFGRGDGSLTEPVTYMTGSEPDDVLAIDLDEDGDLDLVVSNQWSRDLSVFLGDGSGGFEEQPRVDLGERPRGLTAADLDEDGRQEILVAMHIADTVDVFGIDSDGALAFERRIPVQRRPFDLEVTDFDRDGDMDLVVLDDLYDEVHVFTREASGAYVEASSVPLDAIEPRTLEVGDLNQDGFPDAVVANRSRFTVLMNDGLGGLDVSHVELLIRASDLKLGDMDGDGDLDILVDRSYPHVYWNEQGTFELYSGYAARSRVHSFAVDDFNGDGSFDIFTANWDDFATVLLNQRLCHVACPADIDTDGELTLFDYLMFLNFYADGDLRADFDGSGDLTVLDFMAFRAEFDAGCE